MQIKICTGTPGCSPYANMDYMQILYHLHMGHELEIWVSAGFLEPTPGWGHVLLGAQLYMTQCLRRSSRGSGLPQGLYEMLVITDP